MKSKKLVSLLCVAAMSAGLLAGCGDSGTSAPGGTGNGGNASNAGTSTGNASTSEELMTLEFF